MDYYCLVIYLISLCVRMIMSRHSCCDVKHQFPDATDGEYCLNLQHFSSIDWLKIYCHNMETSPTEYITLPAGGEENYSKCQQGGTLSRFFNKVGLDIINMKVIADDYEFTWIEDKIGNISLGLAQTPQWGKAWYCQRCNKKLGELSMNLQGTVFHLPPDLNYTTSGYKPCLNDFSFTDNYQRLSAKCGGNCGGCYPKGFQFSRPRISVHINTSLSVSPCVQNNAVIEAGYIDNTEYMFDGINSTCSVIEKGHLPLACPVATSPTEYLMSYDADNLTSTQRLQILVAHDGSSCDQTDILVYTMAKEHDGFHTRITEHLCPSNGVTDETFGNIRCTFICSSGHAHVYINIPHEGPLKALCELNIGIILGHQE